MRPAQIWDARAGFIPGHRRLLLQEQALYKVEKKLQRRSHHATKEDHKASQNASKLSLIKKMSW